MAAEGPEQIQVTEDMAAAAERDFRGKSALHVQEGTEVLEPEAEALVMQVVADSEVEEGEALPEMVGLEEAGVRVLVLVGQEVREEVQEIIPATVEGAALLSEVRSLLAVGFN